MGALSGRVVTILGASSGIGLAAARMSAREGADVVMMARGKERLENEARAIGATPVVCDVADPTSVRAAFASVDRQHGRLHALLNVAGVARICKIVDATDDDVHYVMGVNLLGPIYTTRAAVPLMRRAGGGDIINVSSESTADYLPGMSLYTVSKGGLDVFSRLMAHELKDEKIRVANYVSGAVSSDFGANFSAEARESVAAEWEASGYFTRVAGPRMDPEWMAEAMLFLLTRPAGQIIDVVHVRSLRSWTSH